jgi:putative membrane protein
MMHHWRYDGWGAGHWLAMGFGMLLFWALVVTGIVLLVRYASSNRTIGAGPGVPMEKPTGPGRPSPREILDERYARGEINDEEYRSRRDTLADR